MRVLLTFLGRAWARPALVKQWLEFAAPVARAAAGLALAASVSGWPGTAAAFTFEVGVGTTDQFGVGQGGTSSSSSLPVGRDSSQNWEQTGATAQSEAVAAAGNVVSQQLIPILSARSFAHWQNRATPPCPFCDPNISPFSGGHTEAGARARFLYGGFVIDGPPGVVEFTVNFEIEGGIRADRVGSNMGASASVGFSGEIKSDRGGSGVFSLGDIFTCERGPGALGFSCPKTDGTNYFQGGGALAGVSGPGRFSVVAASPRWSATVGVPFEIGLELATGAGVFEFQDGAPSNFATAVSDFFNTAGLWDGGPLFNLPADYTAHSLDGLVVDNRLVLPGSGGGGPAPVPEPPTLALLLIGAGVAALARGNRRGRRGVVALAVLAGLPAAGAGGVDAAPVTFGFAGRVTSANFGPDDQPYPNPITIFSGFSGRYTFDSGAADLDPASSVGRYAVDGSPFGLTVEIGGNTFTTANRLVVEVDDAPSADAYVVTAGILALFRLEVGLTLRDPTGAALPSDALPLTPPPLAAFATRTLDFRNDILDRGLVLITGRIDSLTCLAGCARADGAPSLPLPPTLLLLSAPVGVLGVSRFLAARRSALGHGLPGGRSTAE